jgi:hypothetical protein
MRRRSERATVQLGAALGLAGRRQLERLEEQLRCSTRTMGGTPAGRLGGAGRRGAGAPAPARERRPPEGLRGRAALEALAPSGG